MFEFSLKVCITYKQFMALARVVMWLLLMVHT